MNKIIWEWVYKGVALLMAILIIVFFVLGSRLAIINLLSRSDSVFVQVAYIAFIGFALMIIIELSRAIYYSLKKMLKRNKLLVK